MERLTIGKLAKVSGVTVETVRFYERKQLLKQPESQERGFRVYPEEYIVRIHFIKRSQELGFTLKEIKEILDLQNAADATCADVISKAEEKIKEIDEKLADLNQMKASLVKLGNCCDNKSADLMESQVLDYMMQVVPTDKSYKDRSDTPQSCC